MSATTTTPSRAQDATLAQAPLNEPSMEDILASIRKIIAEDQSNALGRSGLTGLTRRVAPPSVDVEPAMPPLHDASHDVDEPVVEPTPPAYHDDHAPNEVSFEALAVAAPANPAAVDEQLFEPREPAANAGLIPASIESDIEAALAAQDVEPLVSPAAGASVSSSFQTLAESVMLQDPDLIERVLRESMRPLLKTWLDDHLPSIVERLVRAEIERVARGGRSRNF